MRKKAARWLFVPMLALGFLLTAGSAFAQTSDQGILKICKVGGLGIPLGTPFTFTTTQGSASSTTTVPAGPAPGGYCMIGPSFSIGSTVTVTETIPAGDLVTNIDVAPPIRMVPGSLNLGTGTVKVQIGAGVTEVTYTNQRIGFVEICKRGHATGNFSFVINPGNIGPFVVPAGACSPSIPVPAGTVTIHELPASGFAMTGCSTIPTLQQGPCDPANQNSTVTVSPGDVSAETIVVISNSPKIPIPDDSGTTPNPPG
jgi:hypothetical protein